MSFALEFRRQHFLSDERAERRAALRRQNERERVVQETRRSHATVLGALLIAGLLLGVFNSSGLVFYARDMAGAGVGEGLLKVSEVWHETMQAVHLADAIEGIRQAVNGAKESRWTDLAGLFGAGSVQAQDETLTAGRDLPLYTGSVGPR